MGFDLIGRKAKNKQGKYWRNNVWWWRPLAQYVLENIELPEKQTDWFMNNGCKVSKISSEKIAEKLQKLVNSGATNKYSKKYKADLKKLPLIKCFICKGTGKRNDENVKGKCNGCNGKGKTKDWATYYTFSVENVKEFIIFAKNSGGFKIC